ncbi:hypothetical protein LTR28_009618 [Elasticomyces elasticus]|nr:hypothetical protein LTR28_009618 [Elasticomyces elasticus]
MSSRYPPVHESRYVPRDRSRSPPRFPDRRSSGPYGSGYQARNSESFRGGSDLSRAPAALNDTHRGPEDVDLAEEESSANFEMHHPSALIETGNTGKEILSTAAAEAIRHVVDRHPDPSEMPESTLHANWTYREHGVLLERDRRPPDLTFPILHLSALRHSVEGSDEDEEEAIGIIVAEVDGGHIWTTGICSVREADHRARGGREILLEKGENLSAAMSGDLTGGRTSDAPTRRSEIVNPINSEGSLYRTDLTLETRAKHPQILRHCISKALLHLSPRSNAPAPLIQLTIQAWPGDHQPWALPSFRKISGASKKRRI